jgi:group II intron reverse transcriptase/maturase
MQIADALLGIYHDRGVRGLPLERVYRQLFNPEFYLRSYGKLYRNDGAMTRGATPETPDGMSMERICAIVDALKAERYVWTPARRINIPKKSGGTRPLGLPTWSDKLLQDVIRSLLGAYYEPRFRDSSHGFRPRRGSHTALYRVKQWKAVTWFIEGDISKCFDKIDHEVLLGILAESVHDNRLLRLVGNMLRAGYLEDWKWNHTLSGTPQGGVISPLLSNIYLDKLDSYVEDELIPQYTRGEARARNSEYRHLEYLARVARKAGDREGMMAAKRAMRSLPSNDPNDPAFRRLSYVRYADDFLLGFVGPKSEAEEIKAKVGQSLAETLHLELSQAKTLVTHARSEAARFLGYEVRVSQANDKLVGRYRKQRSVNGKVALLVPADVQRAKVQRYMRGGKVIHRPELMDDDDLTIIAIYQSEWRGLANYYLMAINASVRLRKVHRAMEISLCKTLAAKHRLTLTQAYRRYRGEVMTRYGPLKTIKATKPRPGKKPLVAEFGGIPLRRQEWLTLPSDPLVYTEWNRKSELVKRLEADRCELCGSRDRVQVHHVRKLSDLGKDGRRAKTSGEAVMIARRRKTLVVCQSCHELIDHGNYDGPSIRRTLESRVR